MCVRIFVSLIAQKFGVFLTLYVCIRKSAFVHFFSLTGIDLIKILMKIPPDIYPLRVRN